MRRVMIGLLVLSGCGSAEDLVAVDSTELTGSVPIGSILVTTASLNLRTGPGTGYAVRHVIPQDARVITVNTSSPRNGWYNISHSGQTGWSYGQYLRFVSSPSGVRFRLPLSLADTQCGGGRCYPTAYYDTNRRSGSKRDWSCRTGGYAKTYDQHGGTDLGIGGFSAMYDGRWVLAAAPGKVIAAHDGEYDRCTSGNCGTANYVMIRHSDGKVTQYWHLKKWSVRVRVGDIVGCGQKIGQVGSSGHATGPHLHFGVLPTALSSPRDPFRHAGECGGSSSSLWTSQGRWGRLPGGTCQ
jgi:murein DD-endopeptidase MepM/ murein hydrolase activator NlpD